LHKYLTDTEVKKLLKELEIIVDTREKENKHVLDYLEKNKIKTIQRGLKTGDYSVQLRGMTLENDIAIERKASIDELCSNLTINRQRFEDEFTRARAQGLRIYLLIENGSFADILSHNYRSRIAPNSLLGSIFSWLARFDVTLMFCKPAESGKIIYEILYHYLREQLKRGG